ncbi:phytanoyl-CoA dioxygenase family protein [Actinokineospora iranica]|uniref:Phytanoyl-CoA dioxygenase (PhyH) n=1 Tax=Actinokineospora iranica TaxID=1271860 RepID=A0A1G6XLW4_9PSEU|nr:hypothetical protein [Actinokineospora iranica]SDD78991.1 hypothetical protein SAMN05216174_11815 [Actinokineospora iranica]
MTDDLDPLAEQVHEQGWCVLPEVIPDRALPAVADLIRAEDHAQAPACAATWTPTSNGSADTSRYQRISKAAGIVAKLGERAGFVAGDRLIGVVRSLLGGYARVSSDFGIVTRPGARRGFWHCDWPFDQSTAARIPQPYGDAIAARPHLEERQVTGPEGSAVLYDARLWHAVAPNRAGESRIALAVRYAPWWLNLEVRRPGSTQALLVDELMDGRPTTAPPLVAAEFDALPTEVRPLYAHWVARP